MSAIVEDTTDNEFKNCRSIYDINEYIYKLIVKNKHLEFVENLEPNITSFSRFHENAFIIPNTSLATFCYQDMVKGYTVAFDATTDLIIMTNKKEPFTLDNEFTANNLYREITPVGGLKELNEKAFKEINRFRSDFLMTLDGAGIEFFEHARIKHSFTFDFNNKIIDSTISFGFNFSNIGFSDLLYNFKITENGITCGLSHKTHYEHFLVGETSKHMMLKFFLNNIGIDNDLETRNHTKEEVSKYMLLIDMKRI
jgi:hypothetical protein